MSIDRNYLASSYLGINLGAYCARYSFVRIAASKRFMAHLPALRVPYAMEVQTHKSDYTIVIITIRATCSIMFRL
jgi:hypothetical protein